MNGSSLVMIGVFTAMSIAIVGLVAYNFHRRIGNEDEFETTLPLRDNSSLEEDLRDILAFIPLTDIRVILNNYLRFDSQIEDTVSFLNDQKKFIVNELRRIPEVSYVVNFLRENGLELDEWEKRIEVFWKTKPNFVRSESDIVSGGLTGMINRMLETVPRNELHELLRQKVKYSRSFRRLLQSLKSVQFADLCNAIEKNAVLNRNFFWAKEAGLEVTLAFELLKNFYDYLTEDLM